MSAVGQDLHLLSLTLPHLIGLDPPGTGPKSMTILGGIFAKVIVFEGPVWQDLAPLDVVSWSKQSYSMCMKDLT